MAMLKDKRRAAAAAKVRRSAERRARADALGCLRRASLAVPSPLGDLSHLAELPTYEVGAVIVVDELAALEPSLGHHTRAAYRLLRRMLTDGQLSFAAAELKTLLEVAFPADKHAADGVFRVLDSAAASNLVSYFEQAGVELPSVGDPSAH